MSAISIISMTVEIAAAVILAAVLGKRKAGGTLAAASVVEVTLTMAVIFTGLSIALASVIYDNEKIGGRYETEGISLSVLPNACGIMLAAAALITVFCLAVRLDRKNRKRLAAFIAAASVTAAAAVITEICILNSSMYAQYVAMILPAVPVLAWTVIVAAADILLDKSAKVQKIILIVINVINLLLVLSAEAALLVLANGVMRQTQADAVGIILLTAAMLIIAAPGITTFICAAVKKYAPSEE